MIGPVYSALRGMETTSGSIRQFVALVADNARQRRVRLGARELSGATASIQINGTTAATGPGALVRSGSLNSRTGVAAKLPDYRRGQRAGDLIIIRAIAPQFSFAPRDRAHVDVSMPGMCRLAWHGRGRCSGSR